MLTQFMVRLAVLVGHLTQWKAMVLAQVHDHMRAMAAGVPVARRLLLKRRRFSTRIPTVVSEYVKMTDTGGEHGRGYYAKRKIPLGELLLREVLCALLIGFSSP